MAALELIPELGYAHICARYEAHNAEQYQAGVLPQSPLEAPEARILVIHGQLDHRRHNHAQCAEADGADERDEWPKIGQCHSDATAENLDENEELSMRHAVILSRHLPPRPHAVRTR